MPSLPRRKTLHNSEYINNIGKNTYKSSEIVEFYVNFETLQPPEHAILNLLRNELCNMKMLDIGVGGGRTTKHFSPLVKEYLGVDYSFEMIQACKKKFPELKFQVVDVRDLSIFGDRQFDFTLFSNNGIDYMNHEDRIKALNEIRRVTNKQGIFCMSTHNLNFITVLLKFNVPDLRYLQLSQLKNKLNLLKFELYRVIRIWFRNKMWLKNVNKEQSLLFNDGAHDFRLVTHYIKPGEQIKQLITTDFRNIRIFGADGKEIQLSNLSTAKDFYLYFLCMPGGS